MTIAETQAKLQMGSVDRMSELPEFILHIFLSFLDAKDACRVNVLSKYWYTAWSSTPVLDFRPLYSEAGQRFLDEDWYDDEAGQRFIECIDETMQRYFEHKHRINKLYLLLPIVNEKIKHLVDKWIGIAVQNHVEELTLTIPYSILSYRLPEILFSAKSLKALNCMRVNLPYYETMDLSSLESLSLMRVNVDTDMLQRIVTFCPMIHLNITTGDHDEISLPWVENGFETTRSFGGGSVQSNVRTSLLRSFVYCGELEWSPWSWNINVGALRNLRTVEISDASITDDVVFQLTSGLVALECLILDMCYSLRRIQISSKSLKEFRIMRGSKLEKVTIDAPNLLEFGYDGGVETIVSLIRVQDCCNAHFCPWLDSDSTYWFVMLKKFLMESNIFRFLVIDLSKGPPLEIMAQEDVLKHFSTCPPYKLRELKLRKTHDSLCEKSSLTALVEGLFWSCRPDVLSITTSRHNTAEFILNILKDKVQCWKHPLKGIEFDFGDTSNFLSRPSDVEIRLRLSWKPC